MPLGKIALLSWGGSQKYGGCLLWALSPFSHEGRSEKHMAIATRWGKMAPLHLCWNHRQLTWGRGNPRCSPEFCSVKMEIKGAEEGAGAEENRMFPSGHRKAGSLGTHSGNARWCWGRGSYLKRKNTSLWQAQHSDFDILFFISYVFSLYQPMSIFF